MSALVPRQAVVEFSVPFHDLDPLDIVWHGHYVKYFELARCALLQQIDYDYPAMQASGYLWPVIDLHLRYIKPLRYGQRVRVLAQLEEWEHRLKLSYRVTDAASGARLARGSTCQVAVAAHNGEMCLVSPPVLWQRLGLPPPPGSGT